MAFPIATQAQFQELIGRVPHSANAVVLLNVEKAKASPTGQAEGMAAKLEQAFRDGLIRVPPSATRFVQASEIDLEFMSPIWEAAVMELTEVPSMELIAKAYHGELDNLDGLPAVALPQDAYVIKLGPKTVGAMAPANRQAVVRWLRDSKSSVSKLSPYLEKAAGYSDKAGTEIIMALDLDGLVSPQRTQQYLQSCQWLDAQKVDRASLNKLLQTVEGIRIGVRLGSPPNGKITVDFKQDAVLAPAVAKRLFLDYLSDKGLLIEDLNEWQPEVAKNTISLSGNLSMPGLRKLMSVIESPLPSAGDASASGSTSPSTGTPSASASTNDAAKTREYFKNVTAMADDLKDDMKSVKNLASTATYCDKYARRIERLPTLGIDKEMIEYGASVAAQLRLAAGVVRTMGIRTGVGTRSITSADSGTGYDPYYYGSYGYGRYGGGHQAAINDVKAVEQQRGIVRAQERGNAAASVQEIKAGLIQMTADTRRKMTEKYQMQF